MTHARLIAYTLLVMCMGDISAGGQNVALREPIKCKVEKDREAADCLTRLKGLVTRSGDVLRLHLEGGRAKVYISARDACAQDQVDKCVIHLLARFYPWPRPYFLVGTNYYECGHFDLVSRRGGSVVEMATVPELSPGGKYWVSVDQDDECDRKYDVAIWSTESDPPALEFKYTATQYENWTVAGWDGDDRIKFKVFVNASQGAYDQDAEVVRSATGWRIVLGQRVDSPRPSKRQATPNVMPDAPPATLRMIEPSNRP
ncbi:MAG TPA: hypothetical protein VGG01_22465 [Xanthobacteraceae bacterium]|jgi:hypothetical protein